MDDFSFDCFMSISKSDGIKEMHFQNIATGETSQAINPYHFFNFSNFFLTSLQTFSHKITFSLNNFVSLDNLFS